VLQGHAKGVESISFSSDCRLLASSSQDESVKIWRLADWALVQTYGWKRFLGLDTFGIAHSIIFSSDGQSLYVGKLSGLEKWRVVTGVDIDSVGKDKFKSDNLVARFEPDSETDVLSIAVSSDNHFVALGSGMYTSSKPGRHREDGTRIKIYNQIDFIEEYHTDHPGLLERILTPGTYVRSLAFSPDGDLLAFTHREESIRVRKVNPDAHAQTGTEKEYAPSFIIPESESGTYARSITFSPDGQLLAAHFISGKSLGNHFVGGNVLLWKVSDRELVQRIRGSYTCFSFSPDSRFIALGGENGTVLFFVRSIDRSTLPPMPIEIIRLGRVNIDRGSIGVETFGGVFTPLIVKGSSSPVEYRQTFSTLTDNQAAMDLHMAFGDNQQMERNISLGKVQITGITPSPKGVPQIEIVIHVDSNREVSISAIETLASDPSSKRSLKIQLLNH
jgi:WD40 repeat protein